MLLGPHQRFRVRADLLNTQRTVVFRRRREGNQVNHTLQIARKETEGKWNLDRTAAGQAAIVICPRMDDGGGSAARPHRPGRFVVEAIREFLNCPNLEVERDQEGFIFDMKTQKSPGCKPWSRG